MYVWRRGVGGGEGCGVWGVGRGVDVTHVLLHLEHGSNPTHASVRTYSRSDDFWIGLHSNEVLTVPDIWEVDCQALSTGVQHWNIDEGEPDDADSSHCTRIELGNRLWRTKGCSNSYPVVCEMDKG